MDNESFGGRSDVIKRITRYQRQGRPANIMKDNALIRVYNARGLDNIFVASFQSGDPDRVAGSDLTQVPEKRVAVCRQADVPMSSWKRSSRDMTDATTQSPLIVPFDHDARYIN